MTAPRISSMKESIHKSALLSWIETIERGFFSTLSSDELSIILHQSYKSLCDILCSYHKSNPALSSIEEISHSIMSTFPSVQLAIHQDIIRTYEGDPSAQNKEEIVSSFPGIRATFIHRIAHIFANKGYSLFARILSEYAHERTGIDIHPNATIGAGFVIDHGTGVVIGETCTIGDNVTIYHGVTLGVLQFEREENGSLVRGSKRHPTIEDNVTIYAEAMILGGDTVVGKGTVIGSNAVVTKSVAPYSKIIHKANV